MNHPVSVLERIQSPTDLKALSEAELEQLAAEMRSELIDVVGRRSAHFASNLGLSSSAWRFISALISPATA